MTSLFDEDDVATDLTINKKYASEYETRKQKEELRKVQFEENPGNDDSTDSSSSEDEDAHFLTARLDADIVKTIYALRKKDATIYNPQVRFFDNNKTEDEESEHVSTEKIKKSQKKTYKDIVREQVLEQIENEEKGIESGPDVENESSRPRLAYDEEQRNIRQAFLSSTKDEDTEEDSDSENLLVVKSSSRVVQNEDDDEAKQILMSEFTKLEQTFNSDKTDTLVDPKGEIQDGNKFLLDYFKNRSWVHKDSHPDSDDASIEVPQNKSSAKNDGNDSDDSLEKLDETDNFEAKYNFRFEQAMENTQSGADFSNISYARGQLMDTLRRKDESRREKRLSRDERKAAERKAKEEQLKRLKNAKRKEMEERLAQVKSILGKGENIDVDEATIMKLLEGDYDPEQFEALMRVAYNDSYYEKEDDEWKNDLDVRESLKTDEDGELIVGEESADGALYDNVDGEDGETGGETDGYEEELEEKEEYFEDEDEQETELEIKAKAKIEDELYKLDYEDIVAGMPTRFKYRQVEPNSYGLATEEILFARDMTLKQYVSLKNMAPYREDGEFKVGARKRRRFRELMQKDLEDELMEANPKAAEPLEKSQISDSATAKKKSRRLKKNKKLSDGERETIRSEGMPEVNEETPKDESDVVEESPKKRRRRSKNKSSETSNLNAPVVASRVGTNEKSSIDAKRDQKQRKREHKKRKQSTVDGVSNSRLESYGLQI